MTCCMASVYKDWCKDEETIKINGKEYCIFHAPLDSKDKFSQPFSNALYHHISKTYFDIIEMETVPIKINPDKYTCNLSGTIFHDDFDGEVLNRILNKNSPYDRLSNKFNILMKNKETEYKEEIQPSFNFEKSIFCKKFKISNLKLSSELNLRHCYFNCGIKITNSTFETISFHDSDFLDDCELTDIGEDTFIDISNCTFLKKTLIANVIFSKKMNMKNSYFNELIFFNASFIDHPNLCSFFALEQLCFKKCQFSTPTKLCINTSKQIDIIDCKAQNTFEIEENTKYYDSFLKPKKTHYITSVSISRSIFDEKFHNKCMYNEKHHKHSVNIIQCTFRGVVNFSNAIFVFLYLQGSIFEKQTILKKSKIMEEFIISNCHFKMNTNFNRSIFPNSNKMTYSPASAYPEYRTSIIDTIFDNWAYFSNVELGDYTLFTGTICERYILLESTDLSKLSLTETNIESFKFIECTWDKDKNNNDCIIDEKNGTPPCKLEEIYRRLKKISKDSANEMQASNWHFKEKEMQMKQLNPPAAHYTIILIALFTLSALFFNIPSEDKIAFTTLVLSCFCAFPIFIYWMENKPLSAKDEIKKIYMQAYYTSSGFGEEPGKAFLILLLLIIGSLFMSLSLPNLAVPILPTATQLDLQTIIHGTSTPSWLTQWLWYLPLTKISLTATHGICEFWKVIFNLLITLQAALFAFALRNKLRR